MRLPPYLLCLVLSLFLLPSASLIAGEIEPALRDTLDNLDRDEFATGVVFLADKVDVQGLTRSLLYPVRLPAAERHERVIRALQDKAQATQQPIIELLDAAKRQNRVAGYTSYWIANIIAIEAKADLFLTLAARSDVEGIYQNRVVELIKPVTEQGSFAAGRGVETGIQGTGAPDLWAMGYRGQGTIVANIDTGVDGNHPALASRWRGLDPGVSSMEAWFDPVTSTTFPQDFQGHGTHTMGTICGSEGSNQIGMAPNAQWIAAATIDRVSIDQTKIDAVLSFQWCADPDGNPATFDDVPVVTSNSWGISPIFHGVPHGDKFFWDAIDGCEAAGCAVVFAAGNEGYYGGETLRTPSDRITSPVNVLSVGSVNSDQVTRTDFSSQGPSGIDHQTIKPEVMAQGNDVRSSTVGGGYGSKSGTSMACPHAAGAIALLKSAYPDATPYEVKAALVYSASDLGAAGPDNEYGNGRINMMAALSFLNQTLIGDTMVLTTHGIQTDVIFSLHGGSAMAGRGYYMLGSVSGSLPGTPLPGGLVLPLNWDYFTELTITLSNSIIFPDFHGNLDGMGNAMARFALDRPPDPAYVGIKVNFAFLTVPTGPAFDFVSNAWEVEIGL